MVGTRPCGPDTKCPFQLPKYQVAGRTVLFRSAVDSTDPEDAFKPQATAHSAYLLSKFPTEILHEIFSFIYTNELWSRSTKVPFFTYVELKDAIISSAGVTAVSRKWRAVVQSMLFPSHCQRASVLFKFSIKDIGIFRELFPTIRGCAVFLGDPNNTPLLESNYEKLNRLIR
jgi:hypothetical protein